MFRDFYQTEHLDRIFALFDLEIRGTGQGAEHQIMHRNAKGNGFKEQHPARGEGQLSNPSEEKKTFVEFIFVFFFFFNLVKVRFEK